MGRLVEAELLLDTGDQRRIEPLRAAVLHVGARALSGHVGLAGGRAHVAAGAAAQAGSRTRVGAGDLGDHLLDRAARRHLHDGEVNDQDAEQGRDDQQQAAQDIGGHQRPRAAVSALALAGSNHQRSCTPRSNGGLTFGRPNLSHQAMVWLPL